MKFILLATFFVSASVLGHEVRCHSDGNASLPVKIKAARDFRSVNHIEVTYSKGARVISETILCSTKNEVAVCKAGAPSAISRVIFHPAFGPSYTIKGEGEIAHWLKCI